MKKNSRNRGRVLLLTGLLSVVFISLSAFTFQHSMRAGDLPVKEMMVYFRQEVRPVVRPMRQDLESKLTRAEKDLLEEARAEIRQAWQIRQDAGLSRFPAEQRLRLAEDRLSDEQVAAIKQSRELNYSALLKVMLVSDKHENELDEMFTSIESERTAWKNELQSLLKENRPARAFVMSPVLEDNLVRIGGSGRIGKLAFVLWNPERQELPYFLQMDRQE